MPDTQHQHSFQLNTVGQRVLSGMRPTGALHLGHYHGALKNWVALQSQNECYFFVADWHALTTHYENPPDLAQNTLEMLVDWLACGVDPAKCTLFLQSRVPEQAELFTLLAMGTPLAWLERVPTYKDQQEKMPDKNLATYGFLGYPLLQAADILAYQAHCVPVGQDQVSHIELTREVARHFNTLYGRGKNFETEVEAALSDLNQREGGQAIAKQLNTCRKAYQEKGQTEALDKALALLQGLHGVALTEEAHQCLEAWLKGTGKPILLEPQALLTEASKLPGLDGQKMSKSYGNAIAIREDKAQIEHKVRRMPTDPARQRRSDPGDPNKCPVWPFHQVYSNADTCQWVQAGCTTAKIGCLECKQPVINAIIEEQAPRLERAAVYLQRPDDLKDILRTGSAKAQQVAQTTLAGVKEAMGLKL